MGRKLVRENELLRSGGLLSFPRTGRALRASVILSRKREVGTKVAPVLSRQPQRPAGPGGALVLRPLAWARKLPNCLNAKSSEERVVYKRLNSTER
jgi:hypothetical protein